jgi:prepilin-type N-terminal cleavage/methylation domain-containing protein
MSKSRNLRRSQGFSLLEVLVAVIILSFGLLALATLQVSLMRSSADSKARTVALALAKDTLEQKRNFADLGGYQALTDGTGAGVTIGGITFTPNWTVDRFIFNQDVNANGILNESGDQQFQAYTTDTGATPASPAGFVANNEFKRLKVFVSWNDAQGGGQKVALEDAVAALSPGDSTLVTKLSNLTSTRTIPAIIKDPALDAMVIPIALGGGVNSAASNPKPQVVINHNTVETSFDVYTYSNISNGTALAQARVETVMVGCSCDFGNGGGSFNKRPTYWDGHRYTVPLDAGYTAPAGVQASQVNNQSSRCDICCRDHHDPIGVTGATFSPRLVTKNSSGAVTAAHPHYADGTSSTPLNNTGTYKEACRLIRVDGNWRVAADVENDYFGLLATGNGTSALTPNPDTTTALGSPTITGGAFARYQQFVLGYMKSRFVTPSPADNVALASYNTVGTPATLAASATYVLDEPTSISMALVDNSAGKWLHARGLYVDYAEQEVVDAIKAAKIDPACTVDSTTLQTCVLRLLSFTSINLTEIADWGPSNYPLQVTNLNYEDALTNNNPVRGHALTNTNATATLTGTATSRKFNSGLLDVISGAFELGTSLPDHTTYGLSDTQSFAVGGGAGGGNDTGDGTITLTRAGYVPGNAFSVNANVTGGTQNQPCNPLSNNTTCGIDGSNSTGLTFPGGVSFKVSAYNGQATAAAQSSPVLTGCTGTGNAALASPKDSTGFTYTGSVCKNWAISSVTAPAAAGTPSISLIVPGDDGKIAEASLISFSGYLVNNDNVTVNFSLTSSTPQVASSCTYVCGNGAANQMNNSNTDCKNNVDPVFTATFPACP